MCIAFDKSLFKRFASLMSAFEPRIEYYNGFTTDRRRRYSTGNNREQFIGKLAILTISCTVIVNMTGGQAVTSLHMKGGGGGGEGRVSLPAGRSSVAPTMASFRLLQIMFI